MNRVYDAQRYPLTPLTSGKGATLLANCQADIERDGAMVLPGFLTCAAITTILSELAPQKAYSHKMQGQFSPYSDDMSTPGDGTLPVDHPGMLTLPASHRFVAGDRIPAHSPLRTLYQNVRFIGFLEAVLNVPKLYPLDDELGCMNLLVYEPGDCNGWHFDTTEFVISLMLQPARRGGRYEYIPGLRSCENENLGEVAWRMRNPDRPGGVQGADLDAGSLFLFKGEFTLHRVTEIEGEAERIVAILSYHRAPGHQLSDGSKLAMYGRVV